MISELYRQTGQHPSAEGAGEEPIIFHQPANNVLEWSTSIESGICMANLCEDWVDESFWRRAYNLSSGKEYCTATWELAGMSLDPMGIKYEEIYDIADLARFNFHGQYYTDSDVLDEYLHFRCIPGSVYRGQARASSDSSSSQVNPCLLASFKESINCSAVVIDLGVCVSKATMFFVMAVLIIAKVFIGSGLGYRISLYITPLFGARSDMVLLSLMLCIERPDIILYADIVYSNPFSDFLQNTVPLSVNILRPFHNSG